MRSRSSSARLAAPSGPSCTARASATDGASACWPIDRDVIRMADLHHGPRTQVRRVVEGPSWIAPAASSPISASIFRLPGVAVWQRPVIEVHLRDVHQAAGCRSNVPTSNGFCRRTPGPAIRAAARRQEHFARSPSMATKLFSEGFADLHTRVYEQILGGAGFGIDDARRRSS